MRFSSRALGTLAGLFVSTFLIAPSVPALAQAKASASSHASHAAHATRPWWDNAVIYEIYPRSFQDSNGDGVGDLNGITSRLDYLKTLGVDAVWLTPIYPSPQVDFGYDISDYRAVDPQYGTLKDFDRLESQAKARDIGVIMDLVPNHTSDQHRWFLESASSRTNSKANWYVWNDGKRINGKREPPNNWISLFGGSAWQWDAKRNQYYYHEFYVQQPDLNWRNPQVRKAMYDVERYWIHQGVAGFRLDAITSLFEDPKLANEPYMRDKNGNIKINAYGDKEVDRSKTDNLPDVNGVLKQLREVADSTRDPRWGKKVVLIGETYVGSIADLRKLYGAHNDELNLPMDTQVGFINKLDAAEFRKKINDAETELNGNEPLFVFDNHDNPRWDRYGDGVHNKEIGRMLAAILFASRDTALMYYGDEIGMKTTPPTRKSEVRDPIGIRGWPKEKGRDGERTPMQWSATANAGFSKPGVKTWLPIPNDFITVNVADEVRDPNSMLNWYKQMIALRKGNAALVKGREVMVNTENPNVLSWLRVAKGVPAVVVACNFTANSQTIGFDLAAEGIHGTRVKTLMKSPGTADPASLGTVKLPAFGVYIGQVE
ncbi:MAG: alpha-glucosidase [Acidobacteriaceae bacterium]